jgi:hypothetical protein
MAHDRGRSAPRLSLTRRSDRNPDGRAVLGTPAGGRAHGEINLGGVQSETRTDVPCLGGRWRASAGESQPGWGAVGGAQLAGTSNCLRPRTPSPLQSRVVDMDGSWSRRSARIVVATASLVAVVEVSCGGDPFDAFVDAYTAAVCKRAFACCAADDVHLATKGSDEANCIALGRANLRGPAAQSIAMGLIRYDAVAGQKCLADLQQSCSAVFEPALGRLVVCGDVFPGARPLGAVCEDLDFICASGDCEGTCVERPPGCASMSCASDQVCVDSVVGCQPRAALNAACRSGQCDIGLTCTTGRTCATPLPDGQRCSSFIDCAHTCTTNSTGPPAGVCRPGICQGT